MRLHALSLDVLPVLAMLNYEGPVDKYDKIVAMPEN